MISVIVFTKGRPMQLHAYLESLITNSDVVEEMISVLYCETKEISYDKIMAKFPKVRWIVETNFWNDLKKEIYGADDYIMFGCDDVVFTHPFQLQIAADYLKTHEKVLGYSVRLGNNIRPMPKAIACSSTIFEWDWAISQERHYNYPWELDCTLYRKNDVIRITEEETGVVKNPNFYEAMITEENREERLIRPHMACSSKENCAIVITVNRVQDTHPNEFDDCFQTDIFTLNRLYNEEDNGLDLEKISNIANTEVHVGAEYFILKNNKKEYSEKKIILAKCQKKINRIITRISRFIEKKKYNNGYYNKKLNISTLEESVELLQKDKYSFLRFGDGEIAIMRGEGIPFQAYDEELSIRLNKLISCKDKGILIGIPRYYFVNDYLLTDVVKKFVCGMVKQRKFLLQASESAINYMDTSLTQAYQTYENIDFENFYNGVNSLLTERDITVICGKGILDKLEYNILSQCKSVRYIDAPARNAYSEYQNILDVALMEEKSRLICVVLGPTAKPLVFDLHQAGYQAWDMGHYFKDYDTYKKKVVRNSSEIEKFYKPD